ncbi:hypothetical protein LTS15_000547 [Exophiala xenobiotica]|nr:hypothetical protein LTS15_000547 [Exophiala xenobiotica]
MSSVSDLPLGRPKTMMSISSQRFGNPPWLGYAHNGYSWSRFQDYPRARGVVAHFVNHSISVGDEAPEAVETFDRKSTAFYQSWFTFGFLEAVFAHNVPEYLLLRQESDDEVVMTFDNLTMILQTWAVAVHGLNGNGSDVGGYLQQVEATQRHVYNEFLKLLARRCFDYPGSDYNQVRCLVNYIACLGEAVSITMQGLYYRFVGHDTIPSTILWPNVPALDDSSLLGTVVADGWCPSTINYLGQTAGISTLRLALLTGPFREGQHSGCSGQQCTAYEVDTENYVAQHTLEECKCPLLKPDIRHITSLLNQGTVPVITAGAAAEHDQSQLLVQDGSLVRYVAFSHVWADGLGSTSEFGLPDCQIRRLAQLASQLVESGAFWIDALCVPEAKELRKQAIRKMADTYQNAHAVLVLDSGILRCDSSLGRKEKILQIHLSAWMRRLWTLQEAILASSLYFQFKDRCIPVQDLVPPFGDQLVDPVFTELGLSMATLTARAQGQEFNITDVTRAMRWRSTSRQLDETLAIASLLSVNISELLNAPSSERMKTLFMQLRNLPKSIVFLAMPRLEVEGFRWAPSTFLFSTGGNMARNEMSAICTNSGLVAEYLALQFERVTIEERQSIRLIDPKSHQPYLIYRELPVSGAYSCNAVLILQHLEPGGMAEAAAVLCTPPDGFPKQKVISVEGRQKDV